MSGEIIRSLNDNFRHSFQRGRVVMTRGIAELPDEDRAAILQKVRLFHDFTEANDPYGEHDFGSFVHNGEKIIWKIDYLDQNLEFGSEDPADPSITTRVLTIMLAEEY